MGIAPNVEHLENIGTRNGKHVAGVSGNGEIISKKLRWSVSGIIKAVDNHLADSITISKSMATLCVVGFLLLQFILNYSGSVISWARSDQTNVEAIHSLKEQMAADKTALTEKINNIQQQFLDKNTETRDDVKELKAQFGKIEQGFQEERDLRNKLNGAKFGALANGENK